RRPFAGKTRAAGALPSSPWRAGWSSDRRVRCAAISASRQSARALAFLPLAPLASAPTAPPALAATLRWRAGQLRCPSPPRRGIERKVSGESVRPARARDAVPVAALEFSLPVGVAKPHRQQEACGSPSREQ